MRKELDPEKVTITVGGVEVKPMSASFGCSHIKEFLTFTRVVDEGGQELATIDNTAIQSKFCPECGEKL